MPQIGGIIAGLIILFAVVLILASVRQVQQGWVGVVKRLGKFHPPVRNPGITFLVPFIDLMQPCARRR